MKKLFFLVSLYTNGYAYSQPCDAVLIPDVRVINDDASWAKSVLNIFQSNKIETFDDYKNYTQKMNTVVDAVPIKTSTEMTAEKFKQFKEDLYKYESIDENSRNIVRQNLKYLSSYVVQAWSDCQNSNGFHIWILQGADPKTFTLAANYNGVSTVHLSKVYFSEIVTTDGGCFTTQNLKTNSSYDWVDAVQYQSFKRINNNPITITASTREAGSGRGLQKELGKVPTDAGPEIYPSEQSKVFSDYIFGPPTNVNSSKPFKNQKNRNVRAKLTAEFGLCCGPAAIMVSISISFDQGATWKTIAETPSDISWTSGYRAWTLSNYFNVKAGQEVMLKASYGGGDSRYNASKSDIQFRVDY